MSLMAGLLKTKPSTQPYPEPQPEFLPHPQTKPITKRFRHGRPDRGRPTAACVFSF
jgi:hypothetical protein